jgi:mycothiol system anti-sigma-R factor
MNCEDTLSLMHGDLDHEIDPLQSEALERHLQACPACRQAYEQQRQLKSTLRAQASYFAAPDDLRARVRAALPASRPAESMPRADRWRWIGAGAAMAATVVTAWSIGFFTARSGANDVLTQQVVASHVRSLMVNHLTDVASSDQHTVKPWFNDKLDFSPPVTDLTEQGFPLVGGRLDYLNERAVAALVFRHRQHRINVFIWPEAAQPDSAVSTSSAQGYNLVRWTRSGMAYCAISDLNPRDLSEFASKLRSAS